VANGRRVQRKSYECAQLHGAARRLPSLLAQSAGILGGLHQFADPAPATLNQPGLSDTSAAGGLTGIAAQRPISASRRRFYRKQHFAS